MQNSLTRKINQKKTGISFPVDDFNKFRLQMLNWTNQFNIFCFLDNRNYNYSEPAFECLLATGCKRSIEVNAGKAYEELQKFYEVNRSTWLFGHFGYDLKNETEELNSGHEDHIGFSDLYFFEPEMVLQLNAKELIIFCDSGAEEIYSSIIDQPLFAAGTISKIPAIYNKIEKNIYINIIEKLRQHILRGDCYEINFCQEFFAEGTEIDPLYIYNQLANLSPNPFSVFYKVIDRYCLCASPERYLKKTGDILFSQPVKGTSKRNPANNTEDERSRDYLLQSPKEKSENVMVVDLVRNDLSRICKAGSVKVDELFGLYSFPQVHQMISTVSGEIEDGFNWIDCIRATFPMGSMTGAPKKRVMELIEQYEQTRRGLFSGAIGYINPTGDFDFNVVIRSILYNETSKYISFQTGSGITYYCNATLEYEECMLKAAAMIKVLQ